MKKILEEFFCRLPRVRVAAISAAATIGSAVIQSEAASDASSAQVGAARDSTAARTAAFAETRKILQPWITTGTEANAGQRDLIGLGGVDAQQAAIDRLKGGAEFGSMKKVGEEAILANASATGGLRGGNVQAGLAQYDQSLLTSLINQQYARLGGLSKDGLTAGGQVAGIGTNVAEGNSADINSAGAAEAGGILGQAKAATGAINGVVNAAGVFMGGRTPVAAVTPGAPIGGFGGGPVFA